MTDHPRDTIRWFRNTAPYINRHRGRTFVLVFDGEATSSACFASLIHDIALLNSLGVRLVLVHGARPQIAAALAAAELDAPLHNNLRVTTAAAMHCVKAAVGALRIDIESLLSMGLPNSPMQGAGLRVHSGNYVTARPIGVVDGVDHQLTGQVRNIDTDAIERQLDAGGLVLLSPLGHSPTGETFNLAHEDVAVRCAAALGAEKLILFSATPGLLDNDGKLLLQCTLDELAQREFAEPRQAELAQVARQACEAGVERCHVLSHEDDCALLQELFTHDGCGTLVTRGAYEQCRSATIDDVGGILELIEPLERQGVLLKRSRELLETEIDRFRLLVRDERIVACAALYPFAEDSSGELACIVTHPDYRSASRGQRLLAELEREAQRLQLQELFVLTTQTAHWFLEQGFVEASLESLPERRQALYNLQRNSKVLRKTLV